MRWQEARHAGADIPQTEGCGGRALAGQGRGDGLSGAGDQPSDLLPVAERLWRDEDRSGEASGGPGEGKRAARASGRRQGAKHPDPEGSRRGKLPIPERRRRCVPHIRERLGVSQGRVGCSPRPAQTTDMNRRSRRSPSSRATRSDSHTECANTAGSSPPRIIPEDSGEDGGMTGVGIEPMTYGLKGRFVYTAHSGYPERTGILIPAVRHETRISPADGADDTRQDTR